LSFETGFFGPGNRLRWEAIQARSLPVDVQQRLGPFLEGLERNPEILVLPRVLEDGRVQWYVMCRSSRVARIARDEVRGFLGPTYSDFEGRPSVLDPSDPVEATVLTHYGRNAFMVEVPDRRLFDAARDRLQLYIQVRAERPSRYGQRVRAVGRILRDFEYALLSNQESVASDCIEELRLSGHLSATNLLFLDIRRLGVSRHWEAILARPELEALLAMVRPRRVTEALVRAVYSTYLKEFEEGDRAAEAVGRFRAKVSNRFRDLYRTRANLTGFEVDASFLMAAATSFPARPDVAEAILENYVPDSVEFNYLRRLAEQIPSASPVKGTAPLDDARNALAEADVDRAYELAMALPHSFNRTALLLRCARDMGTLAAAQTALESIDDLSSQDRTQLETRIFLVRIRDSLEDLRAPNVVAAQPAIDQRIPANWGEWLKRLSGQEPWRAALSVAETGAREWSIEEFLREPDSVDQTADLLLSDRPEWGQIALRDALPYFVEFFVSAGPNPRLKLVYENLFLTVALDTHISLPQVAALVRIAEARLQLGVSAVEYVEILRQLASAILAVESPSATDVTLDALEVVVNAAAPDPNERQRFALQVAVVFQRWRARIDAAQFAILRSIAHELGVSAAIAGPEPTARSVSGGSEWASLSGRRIAMYSLQESALRRAAQVVTELCPGVRVDGFHDHVGGSPALRKAASTADIFIVATAAAKHAATTFIESRRPKGSITLYSRGQGSSSLLQALRQHLEARHGET
jgi:hypothetical protein